MIPDALPSATSELMEAVLVALTMIEHEIAIMDDDGEELDAGMAAILRESDFAPHDFESLPPLVDEEIPVTLPDLVLIEGKTLFFGDN